MLIPYRTAIVPKETYEARFVFLGSMMSIITALDLDLVMSRLSLRFLPRAAWMGLIELIRGMTSPMKIA